MAVTCIVVKLEITERTQRKKRYELLVAPFLSELESVLSTDRLERYRPDRGSDLDMLSAYFWNAELCETLYHTLGALEMSLRNSLSDTLETLFNRNDWYNEPGFLQKREATDVFTASFDLKKQGKPVTPGRIIARQTFGFWTSLLSSAYNIWSENNHHAITLAFPNAPAHNQYRSRAFDRMNALRVFRNRVFHYEPVIYGLTPQNGRHISLLRVHAEVIDAIGWMNSAFQDLVSTLDRFPTVYNGGTATIESRIKLHLGVM